MFSTMVHPEALLRDYARLILHLSGAGSISLFAPAFVGGERELLIHEGDLPPVPELTDAASAARFRDRAFRDRSAGPGADLPGLLRSSEADCRLIRVPFDTWLSGGSGDSGDGAACHHKSV